MKEDFSISTLGGTSLMLIFAVLCLTVFAVLSLSTAKAGDQLSESMQTAVQDYYDADNKAEEILASLRRGEFNEEVEDLGDDTYSYRCPINERLSLYVSVQVSGDEYEILQWQAAVDDSMIFETQEVWDGMLFPEM